MRDALAGRPSVVFIRLADEDCPRVHARSKRSGKLRFTGSGCAIEQNADALLAPLQRGCEQARGPARFAEVVEVWRRSRTDTGSHLAYDAARRARAGSNSPTKPRGPLEGDRLGL